MITLRRRHLCIANYNYLASSMHSLQHLCWEIKLNQHFYKQQASHSCVCAVWMFLSLRVYANSDKWLNKIYIKLYLLVLFSPRVVYSIAVGVWMVPNQTCSPGTPSSALDLGKCSSDVIVHFNINDVCASLTLAACSLAQWPFNDVIP